MGRYENLGVCQPWVKRILVLKVINVLYFICNRKKKSYYCSKKTKTKKNTFICHQWKVSQGLHTFTSRFNGQTACIGRAYS